MDPAPRACLTRRYRVVGQMNVLQLAKYVRELSLIISVAENTVPSGVAGGAV